MLNFGNQSSYFTQNSVKESGSQLRQPPVFFKQNQLSENYFKDNKTNTNKSNGFKFLGISLFDSPPPPQPTDMGLEATRQLIEKQQKKHSLELIV